MESTIMYKRCTKLVQRTMALEEGYKERSYDFAEGHRDCSRHDCDTACGIDGYCGASGAGYPSDRAGEIKSKDYSRFRHDKSRRYL